MTFFIYCSRCGFYPSNETIRVGIPNEIYAENLSKLHRTVQKGHETFLVPDHWFDDNSDTIVKDTFR